MVQEISPINSQNKYVIPNQWNNVKRELNEEDYKEKNKK